MSGDGMLGMHRPVPRVFNSPFSPNPPLTHSLQSLTWKTDSLHANAVTEVRLSLPESDYARTTCIIRFFGLIFPRVIKWIQEDILLLLPLTARVNMIVRKSASVGQTFLVKAAHYLFDMTYTSL